MENPRIVDSRGSLAFSMENPFSLKFGQVFTGFGIGCGVGIGVGRPIYLGAIPMMQQVMSATRGATDAFSGVGQHVNSSLRKLGMKKIEAGVGCGVGIGHGFGVGISLKPGVVHQIQFSVLQAVTKLMSNMGFAPSLSSIQSVVPGSVQSSISAPSLSSIQSIVPGSVQSSISAWTSTSGGDVHSSAGDAVDLASKTAGSSFHFPKSNGSVRRYPSTNNLYEPHVTSDISHGSRTEKVLDSFLQSPIFKHDEDIELNEMAEKLRKESNVLHVLLKHQQAIQGLIEENQKLRRILVEELKVPPSKIHAISDSFFKLDYPCSDCFECRRRKRKAWR